MTTPINPWPGSEPEDPAHPISAWQAAVKGGETRGYHQWVSQQKHDEADRLRRANPPSAYLLTAEHFEVPGQVRKLFWIPVQANDEAAALVNTMLADADRSADATREDWKMKLEALKATFEDEVSDRCFVEIEELPLWGWED